MSQIIKTITASSAFKESERLRAKARHDEAQALYHAKQEGIEMGIQKGISERNLEIARMMLADNAPIEHIVRYSGLSKEEILGLS